MLLVENEPDPGVTSGVRVIDGDTLGNAMGNRTTTSELADVVTAPHWIINPPGNFWYPFPEKTLANEFMSGIWLTPVPTVLDAELPDELI